MAWCGMAWRNAARRRRLLIASTGMPPVSIRRHRNFTALTSLAHAVLVLDLSLGLKSFGLLRQPTSPSPVSDSLRAWSKLTGARLPTPERSSAVLRQHEARLVYINTFTRAPCRSNSEFTLNSYNECALRCNPLPRVAHQDH